MYGFLGSKSAFDVAPVVSLGRAYLMVRLCLNSAAARGLQNPGHRVFMAFESSECFEGEFWLLTRTCRERQAFTVTVIVFFIIIIIFCVAL